MAFQAIASELLNNKNGEVALIDTTGSFSPLRLRDLMVSRLMKRSRQLDYQQVGHVYEPLQAEAKASDDIIVEATSLLDHVKVMRVFDFAGVIEAVNEIGEMWEREVDHVDDHPAVSPREESRIIDDSEGDEVSFSNENENERENEQLNSTRAANYHEESNRKSGYVCMIVIDTMTNVVSSMISGNQVQGTLMVDAPIRACFNVPLLIIPKVKHCLQAL